MEGFVEQAEGFVGEIGWNSVEDFAHQIEGFFEVPEGIEGLVEDPGFAGGLVEDIWPSAVPAGTLAPDME